MQCNCIYNEGDYIHDYELMRLFKDRSILAKKD